MSEAGVGERGSAAPAADSGDGPPDGRVLLALARAALEEALGGRPAATPEQAWLERPGACFVTLKLDGRLRGCIGSMTPRRPLAEDVRENACAAALRDPRFPPVTASELPRLRLELSLLSPLEEIDCAGEEELTALLRPGVDGLLLEHGSHRGTFLPAVWESLRTPAEFVCRLKVKAGLPEDFWAPQMRIWRYTVRSWKEG